MIYRVEINGQDSGAVIIEENHSLIPQDQLLVYMIYRIDERIKHHLINFPVNTSTNEIFTRMTELAELSQEEIEYIYQVDD